MIRERAGTDVDGWPIYETDLIAKINRAQAESDRTLRDARRRLAPISWGRDIDRWPEVDRR